MKDLTGLALIGCAVMAVVCALCGEHLVVHLYSAASLIILGCASRGSQVHISVSHEPRPTPEAERAVAA